MKSVSMPPVVYVPDTVDRENILAVACRIFSLAVYSWCMNGVSVWGILRCHYPS